MEPIPRATHKDLVILISDIDDAVVPITGFPIATFTLSRKRGSGALVSKALGSGVVITDGPGGVVTVSLDDSDTDRLGTFAFECRVQDGVGNKSSVVRGYLTFEDG